MNTVAIRGAITVNENNSEDIIDSTIELIKEIEKRNKIDPNSVISILFSTTKDLNAEYPAKAARLMGYTKAALMCFNEMEVVRSLKKCIRVMILCNSNMEQNQVSHVYLRDASILRPDLK